MTSSKKCYLHILTKGFTSFLVALTLLTNTISPVYATDRSASTYIKLMVAVTPGDYRDADGCYTSDGTCEVAPAVRSGSKVSYLITAGNWDPYGNTQEQQVIFSPDPHLGINRGFEAACWIDKNMDATLPTSGSVILPHCIYTDVEDITEGTGGILGFRADDVGSRFVLKSKEYLHVLLKKVPVNSYPSDSSVRWDPGCSYSWAGFPIGTTPFYGAGDYACVDRSLI